MEATSTNGPIPVSEAWERFVTGLSGTDIAWLVITVLLVTSVYYIAVLRKTKTAFTKATVLRWIVILLGWTFAFFVFGKYRIFTNNDAAPALFIVVSIATCIISITLFDNNKVWYWIISNTVMAILIFGMAFTFAIGVQSYSYGILFGSLLGIFIARLYQAIKHLNKNKDETDESLLDDRYPTGI